MPPELRVTKLDAAKRQLETYIRLYFHEGDPVAMHSLAAAAFGIIKDINAQNGGDETLFEKMLEAIKPELRDEIRGKMVEAQNFFKHADRDPDETLLFYPESTEFMALDACSKYIELSGENPPLFQVFNGWMMITRTDMYMLSAEKLREVESAAAEFIPTGRLAYFRELLPRVMREGT